MITGLNIPEAIAVLVYNALEVDLPAPEYHILLPFPERRNAYDIRVRRGEMQADVEFGDGITVTSQVPWARPKRFSYASAEVYQALLERVRLILDGPSVWDAIQAGLVDEVRRNLPRHTIRAIEGTHERIIMVHRGHKQPGHVEIRLDADYINLCHLVPDPAVSTLLVPGIELRYDYEDPQSISNIVRELGRLYPGA